MALCFAPDQTTKSINGLVCDLLRPGLAALRWNQLQNDQHLSDREQDSVAPESVTRALEIEREKNRALQVRIAQLVEQYETENQFVNAIVKADRLLGPQLIDVGVLTETIGEPSRAGHLLEQGKKHGLRENELVLLSRKSQKSVIDVGTDNGVSVEDSLLLGRSVIGKVDHVGQWTSTCILVTDVRYRGRAQLIRETSDGLFSFEAQGILKGRGDRTCVLEGIPAESAVRVGDAVFTAERDGSLPTPLYYGEVIEAELKADDRQWTIVVQPMALPSRLTHVQILRTVVNAERLAVK